MLGRGALGQLNGVYVVAISIKPGPATAASPIDPAAVADILWVNVRSEDRIEYIKSGAGPSGVDIVVFLHSDGLLTASQTAHAVCLRALGGSPEFRHWAVDSLSTSVLS